VVKPPWKIELRDKCCDSVSFDATVSGDTSKRKATAAAAAAASNSNASHSTHIFNWPGMWAADLLQTTRRHGEISLVGLQRVPSLYSMPT
jgi:hypothetical protein